MFCDSLVFVLVLLLLLIKPVIDALLHALVGLDDLLMVNIVPLVDDGLLTQPNEIVILFLGFIFEDVLQPGCQGG